MRAAGVRRRAVLLTLALAALALGPALFAAATPSRPAVGPPTLTGTLVRLDLAHHRVAVKATTGAARYRGRTVTVTVRTSPPGATTVRRLGRPAPLRALRTNDRVSLTYRLDRLHHVVAIRLVDSGPAPTAAPTPTPTPTTGATSSTTPSPSSAPATTGPPSGTTTVGLAASNYRYDPQPLTVHVGDTVVFSVSGSHSWTSGTAGTPDHRAWDDSGVLSGSQTFSYTFTAANPLGTYNFFCSVHYPSNGMSGSLTLVS